MLHGRAWKGFDWDSPARLHAAGWIGDPRGRAKSVVFTAEGLERAERLLGELFARDVPEAVRPANELPQD